ncbi:DUF7114 family protein [Halomicrococcus gelatinilyticus]|uniref:DUF7114 family protein n=1 Tax=Halomicrococcus gelatinilyticus TaxID=1702103 RepID=UPI002E140F7A
MEEAVRARGAAREAVRDITPEHLRDYIDGLLESSAMTPGVLTLLSARAVDGATGATGARNRAAGVQLIYEGLRLTRSLAVDEPWEETSTETESNVAILAATVMVSRGFYVLARTEAADKAVETVQSFGRDQTTPDGLDRSLEADVFELAIVAGTTVAGADAPSKASEYASELADSVVDGDETPVDAPEIGALPDDAEDALSKLSRNATVGVDERRSSSVTDP